MSKESTPFSLCRKSIAIHLISGSIRMSLTTSGTSLRGTLCTDSGLDGGIGLAPDTGLACGTVLAWGTDVTCGTWGTEVTCGTGVACDISILLSVIERSIHRRCGGGCP